MTETDYRNRINKLDSFFLWIASLSGVGFSIFISYLHLPILFYAPVFVLIAIGVGIGYLDGAVFNDSFTNRMRGWNYVLMGLAIYVPFACLNYSGLIFVNNPDTSFIQTGFLMIAGLMPVGLYLLSVRITTPKIYRSFGLKYGIVTSRILNRTTMASILVGFTLFLFSSAMSSMTDIVGLIFFGIIVLLFVWPVPTQEKRIRKLLPLEQFQDCIQLEQLEKKRVFSTSQAVLFTFTALLLISSQLPNGDLKSIMILASLLGFIASVVGVLVSLLYSDRGDMVRIKDTFERELDESEIETLNRNVNLANS
jgi:hypothetical protein